MTAITKTELLREARASIREHNLDGWEVRLDRANIRAGFCHYGKKEISLSWPIACRNGLEAFRNTILHEIAHALVGKGRGHGPDWRRVAVSIGCNGNRTHNHVTPKAPIVMVCPNGHEHPRFKRSSRKVSCGICSPRFDERFILVARP